MIKFHKIDYEQYKKDLIQFIGDGYKEEEIREVYDSIKLPKRATACSAGYDFFAPFGFALGKGATITFPTGICAEMDNDVVLMLFPRSGLGFKYRCQLDNTVGIIDADYYGNVKNGGHIMVKLTNDSHSDKKMAVKQGDGYMQGIFVHYCLTEDDSATGTRVGGFGSTTA